MSKGSTASSENHRGTRWLLPSIADLIFLALVGVLVFSRSSVGLLGDAGIGWHIRTGQLILATHTVPHTDPFSSSMTGQPWFAWEWLFDVIVGWLDQMAGLNGVVLFAAIVIAATFSCMFRPLIRRGASLLVALFLLLLAASASMIHFFARPHVITWFFTVLWLSILDRCEQTREAEPRLSEQNRLLLFLLPISMLLWVNIHGGFLLGFALLAIYWLGAMWQRFRRKRDHFDDFLVQLRARKRARDVMQIAVLSAVATFVNPYGWRLHQHIYRYLNNRFLMDHIDEFQSPNFHGLAQKCFALLLLLTLLALATNKDAARNRPTELLLTLFAAYSGLYAARNIPISSLLLIWVISPKLSRTLSATVATIANEPASSPNDEAESFPRRMQAMDSSLRGHLWPIAAIALSSCIAFHGGKAAGSRLMNAHFDAQRFPVFAVDYLTQRHVPGPIFSPDAWGGYLIYRLYPQTKVVIDDRHDFYGEPFVKSYLKTVRVEAGWQDFLLAQRPGCILIPENSALANILLETPQWRRVYSDKTAVVFEPQSASPESSARLQLPSH